MRVQPSRRTRRAARRQHTADVPLPLAALIVLGGAIFVSMTIEFLPGGLLSRIAEDLVVSVGAAGQLVSVFAATVIACTVPVAVLTRRVDRRLLLVVALGGIVAGSLGTALAPDYGWLLAARVLGGVAHGAFWSVAAAYTAHLVPAGQLARATVITSGGGSLAGILGIPIGNALGQAFGWRWAFGVLAVVGVVAMAALIAVLPRVERSAPTVARRRRTPDATLVPVLALCGIIMVVVVAQTGFGTYLTPWLEDIAGLPAAAVPAYLLATGLAGAVGLAVSGALGDRHPRATLVGSLAVVLASVVLFAFADASPALVLVGAGLIWSGAFGAVSPLLQARMMRTASTGMRDAAAALQTVAYNVGIGGGAALGGAFVGSAGLGALPLFAIAATAVSLAVVVTWDRLTR